MNFNFHLKILIISLCAFTYIKCTEYDYCEKDECFNEVKKYRYLFYDVNPPEGFNLRRDVFMRFAVFVYNLQRHPTLNNFKLVLPPWTNLYHWKDEEFLQIPWSKFFDLKSLAQFVPVIEMYQFFEEMGPNYSKIKIDEVYILQNFEEMFKTGKFEDKMEVRKCKQGIETNFYFYRNVSSDNIKCLSFHGHATQLSDVLDKTEAKTVLFDHAEIALHDYFGNEVYWQARRSMRFNKDLREVAADFRKKFLNSTDLEDNAVLPDNWRDEKPKRSAIGGPYLSVHMRRMDFAWGRSRLIPTIEHAAQQIKKLLAELELKKVFIATDSDEFEDLKAFLKPPIKVYRFLPPAETQFLEGELAIIDQIICSYARYFLGTHESTFSFRIQEEREILGFPEETTFNRLCGKDECENPSKWKIVY